MPLEPYGDEDEFRENLMSIWSECARGLAAEFPSSGPGRQSLLVRDETLRNLTWLD